MGKMGQKERDRYNIARGGTAGMATLIPAPKKGAKAAAPAAAAAVAPPAAFTPRGALDPQWFMGEYARKDAEANAANERRYGEINAGYGDLISATAQRYGDLNQGYNDQRQEFGRLNNEIQKGYDDRYKRNMGELEVGRLQEAADINDASMAQRANIGQQMQSSGLAGTTAMATLDQGNERRRIAEQARLNERLRSEKLNADMALSGDALAYKERGGNVGNQLSADQLRFRTGATEVNTALNQAQLGFKERREDVGPDMGQYAQIAMALGQGGYGQPGSMGGPGAGGVGGGVPAGPYGGAGRPGVGGSVTEMTPGGWNAGAMSLGQYQKSRPLTAHEQSVLRMGGTVSGYSPSVASRGISMAPSYGGGFTGAGAASTTAPRQSNRAGMIAASARRRPQPVAVPRPVAPVKKKLKPLNFLNTWS